MGKTHTQYKTGEFTDYNGVKRQYVICAYSQTNDNPEMQVTSYNPSCDCLEYVGDIQKSLSLGIAIQRDGDTPDFEIGKKIALGKAMKKPYSVLYCATKGVINTPMVTAVLEQEGAYFERFPEAPSYNMVAYRAASCKKKMK